MLPHEPPAWYAIRTFPKHERTVATILENRDITHFLPIYRSRTRWSDRTKVLDRPLFPSYLFAYIGYSHRLQVLNLASVMNIVSYGRREVPVPDQEIDAIRRLMASGIPLTPWRSLSAGQCVHILRGPLEGLQGQLIRVKNDWRMIVSVPLLQRAIAAEIDVEYLAPVPVPTAVKCPSLSPAIAM